MRVIAGSAKGRPLRAPRGTQVRPTSDKVKGAIFSMLESILMARRASTDEEATQEDLWRGLRFLDLYAGSGALAIEALSRGADSADLVEANPAVCRLIRRNLEETGLASRATVHCLSVERALGPDSRLRGRGGYDIIALDPPYADPTIDAIARQTADSGLARGGGLVVVEHSRRVNLADRYGSLTSVRRRTHGDTSVTVYAMQEASS